MLIFFVLHNWNRQQGETESLQRWLLHRQNVLASYVLTWLILELVLFAHDRSEEPSSQVSPLEQFDLASFFLKSLQLFPIQLKIHLLYASQMFLPLPKRVILLNFLSMVVRKVSIFFCLYPHILRISKYRGLYSIFPEVSAYLLFISGRTFCLYWVWFLCKATVSCKLWSTFVQMHVSQRA